MLQYAYNGALREQYKLIKPSRDVDYVTASAKCDESAGWTVLQLETSSKATYVVDNVLTPQSVSL
jgi:hypothetical protein